ncbi:hypothetical protein [Propionibacterium sp.]|uniref:hypothetical protein n=1 Tax=Propionibacterium sp. TaxID=1977903 RepID=UPI0039E86E20
MAFEVFNKRVAPLGKEPSVTIQRRGIFSFNGAAHKLIDNADTVELLFDRERNVIGIRPAAASPNTYQIRPQPRSNTGLTLLSAAAFTQYYRIDTSVSRRWRPTMKDGILCIDLNGESAEVHGNRKPTASSGEEPSTP